MKRKISIVLVNVLLLAFTGYSQQDSVRTRNDKPGTPQSLRTADQSPQTHVNTGNSNTAPGQTVNHAATGSTAPGNPAIADPNTGRPVSTTPVTLQNQPAPRMDTSIDNSAIQNGINNAPKAIRK